jgi:hypothetical protein
MERTIMANGPSNISLTVVVNGQPIELKNANPHEPLRAVANQALAQSGNSGQPLDGWELRDSAGNVLDFSKPIKDYGLAAGVTLFLSLRAGVGG